MGQITIDQSHQVMATLAVNTVWDEVDFEESGLQDLVIRNPKEAGRRFTDFLKNSGRLAVTSFATFKTIKLGTLKDANAICKAITDAGVRINILNQPAFTVATEETEVELVVASVAELGFKDGAEYSVICERAKQLDLELCPAEVGPQLRLQYLDQPNGEWLRIAMEPITFSDGNLCLFGVGRVSNEFWLDSSRNGRPGGFWLGLSRFVFVRRK